MLDLSRDLRQANTLFVSWIVFTAPFCGFFMRQPEIPVYWFGY